MDLLPTIRALIQELLHTCGSYIDQCDYEQPGSIAYSQWMNHSNPTKVETAFGQGMMINESAADHLFGYCRLLEEPLQTIVNWTCARGVLEASALTQWFMDPDIDALKRVSRSLSYRYAGLKQQRAFAHMTGKEDIVQLNNKIENIVIEAKKWGYSKVNDRRGKEIGAGQAWPKMIEIVKKTLDMEFEYRLFSAMAHSQPWAMRQMGFRIEIEGDRLFTVKHLQPSTIVMLTTFTIQAFKIPTISIAKLFNLDTNNIRKSFHPLESYLNIMGRKLIDFD